MSNALTLEDRRNGNGGPQTHTPSCAAENRLVQVSGAATASFVYDGDGKRVLAIEGGTTTVFIGNYFEWSGTPASAVRYDYAGTTRLAMRRGSGSVTWLLGDHLGSTSVSYDGTSALHQGYKPWGETRFGEMGTPYQFTGQYRQASLGLDFFNARWYDPALGRFAQADTLIPEASQGVQAWDRYAYVNNSPLNYIDPTGRDLEQIMFDKGEASWRRHLENLTSESRHRDQRNNITRDKEYNGPKLPATGDTSDESDCSCNANDILGGTTLIAFGSVVAILGVGLVTASVAELTITSPTIVGVFVGLHGFGVGLVMTVVGAIIVGAGIKTILNSGCLPPHSKNPTLK